MTPVGDARSVARTLKFQATWPASIVAAGLVAAPYAIAECSTVLHSQPLGYIAAAAGVLAALTVLAISTLLVFDARLFRVMSTYPDDQSAGKAVDDLLSRMRVKSMLARTRTLAERIGGTRRLIVRQRLALVAFVLLSGMTVLDVRF